jgi:hypothetical protein
MLPAKEPKQPSQNPGLRPKRANTMLAGIEAHIIAVIWIAIGSVISVLSIASEWPTRAAMTVWPDMTAFIKA